jgi:hypothetical protein
MGHRTFLLSLLLSKFILVNYVSGAAPQRGVAAPERAPDFCFTSFYIYLYVFI